MSERRFEVLQENDRLAADMCLEDALLFIYAIFDTYHYHIKNLSIREMENGYE